MSIFSSGIKKPNHFELERGWSDDEVVQLIEREMKRGVITAFGSHAIADDSVRRWESVRAFDRRLFEKYGAIRWEGSGSVGGDIALVRSHDSWKNLRKVAKWTENFLYVGSDETEVYVLDAGADGGAYAIETFVRSAARYRNLAELIAEIVVARA